MNTYTNLKFMQGKRYDPARYYNLDSAAEPAIRPETRAPEDARTFTITEEEERVRRRNVAARAASHANTLAATHT